MHDKGESIDCADVAHHRGFDDALAPNFKLSGLQYPVSSLNLSCGQMCHMQFRASGFLVRNTPVVSLQRSD